MGHLLLVHNRSLPLRALLARRPPPKPRSAVSPPLSSSFRPRRLPLFWRAAMGSIDGSAPRLAYPPARRDDSVVDDYHGVRIPDPYRWLEDPDSEETKEFVARQAELAETVLAGCPDRENLHREITRLFDHPRYRSPVRRGNKYFHFHNSGLQAQSVLYMQDDLDGKAEVLLDPNTLSKDGTVARTRPTSPALPADRQADSPCTVERSNLAPNQRWLLMMRIHHYRLDLLLTTSTTMSSHKTTL